MELENSIDKYSKDEKRTQLKHLLEDLGELLSKEDLDIETRKHLLDFLRELNSKPVNCDGANQVGRKVLVLKQFRFWPFIFTVGG